MTNPDPNVIEISLIGPGYGESIVIHIGEGEWMIVDSCADRSLEPVESAALTYLRKIGVDPKHQVTNIIATHWHDDHMARLSRVVDECSSAKFWCAAALTKREFVHFAAIYAAPAPSPITRSTNEIMKTFETLKERGTTPRYLLQDTLIRKTATPVTVHALSPSHERVHQFLKLIATSAPKEKSPQRRMGDLQPNAVAVALLIDFECDSVLLGADLEENPGGGWSAVVAGSEIIRGKRSSVFKVSHHGSETGHSDAVWAQLLVPEPFAILTPFSRGKKPLPSRADVDRISSYTTNAYSVSRLISTSPVRRDRAVERTLQESGWRIRSVDAKMGQVRLRRSLTNQSDSWTVELFGNAVHLKHVHG